MVDILNLMLTIITCHYINYYQVYCGNNILNRRQSELPNFSFIVSIQSIPDFYPHCGGSLISWRHVLTAAHCVVQSEFYNNFTIRRVQDFRIVAGDLLCVKGKPESGNVQLQIRYPIEMIAAPQYKPIQTENDIGIIIVDYNFDQSEYVNIISISWFTPKPMQRCLFVVCGEMKNELQNAEIQIRDQSCCNSSKLYNGKMPKFTICASIDNRNSNSSSNRCGSGYPLICQHQLHGVISFGFGCEIFTDISIFSDWIDSMAKEHQYHTTAKMRSINSGSINLNTKAFDVMVVMLNIILYLCKRK